MTNDMNFPRSPPGAQPERQPDHGQRSGHSEGGMIRLETLIELEIVNSSFRTQISQFELFELILLLRLDRQLPVEQFEASRAIRGSIISVSSTLPTRLRTPNLPTDITPTNIA